MRLLEEAEKLGCLNAVYNLGAIHLDDQDTDKFSFSKAYEKFAKAAQTGHAMAAYNVAVMNMSGTGTYKSIKLANAFLKHVVNVGEFAMDLSRAYELVEQGNYKEALFIYLEQAEMGQGIGALNAALLLEKHHIFDTEQTLLGEIAA